MTKKSKELAKSNALPGVPVEASIELNLKLTQNDIIDIIQDDVNSILDEELIKLKDEAIFNDLESNKEIARAREILWEPIVALATFRPYTTGVNFVNSNKEGLSEIDRVLKARFKLLKDFKYLKVVPMKDRNNLLIVGIDTEQIKEDTNVLVYYFVNNLPPEMFNRRNKIEALKKKSIRSIIRLKIMKAISDKKITSDNIVAVSKTIAIEVVNEALSV